MGVKWIINEIKYAFTIRLGNNRKRFPSKKKRKFKRASSRRARRNNRTKKK